MSKILTIAGAILAINGLCLFVMANLDMGTVLTILLGVLFLIWGIFYKKIRGLTEKGIGKFIKRLIILFLCVEAVFIGFVAIYGQNDNANFDEDAVIVLGGAVRGDEVTLPLKQRLDKAVEYHKQNPEALIVVTGGQGVQETATEASVMEKYLIDNGVDKDIIIKEEKATSTKENMIFSKEILDTYFDDEYKIVVITNNFHIYRGVTFAKLAGFENVFNIHAGLPLYNLVPCYLRETMAILKMWIFR